VRGLRAATAPDRYVVKASRLLPKLRDVRRSGGKVIGSVEAATLQVQRDAH
jgi:hypothetical protein